MKRSGRKRGGKSSTRGISDDQVAVIVTADRSGAMDLAVATMGPIAKKDIDNAIGNKIGKESILCADGYVSYKGFAKDNNLSLVVLRADLKQHVKQRICHIQNVNSMHNRVKKWIGSTFWGVSTKYLQYYLNWNRIQEAYKKSICVKQDMANGSTEDIFSLNRYRLIDDRYQTLIPTKL